jgi:peptide/nickel transport system substrate-binding protein
LIRSRKAASAGAVLIALSLVAAACGGDDGDDATDTTAPAETTAAPATTAGGDTTAAPDTTEAPDMGPSGGTITYGYEQEFFAYNANTSDANASSNAIVLGPVLPGTMTWNPDGTPAWNLEFLTEEPTVTSEDPFTIEFSQNPDAAWSDGEAIDCDDWKLVWASANGVYKRKNADGTVATDPETGAELLLFDVAGTTGYEDIESLECDGSTVTATFSKPFSDWQTLFSLGAFLPAHIVEQESGVADLEAAIDAGDEEQLAAAAEFFNTGWKLNPGELKLDLMPSGGPFTISDWQAGQSLTLTRNENYWGTPANADSIVFRYIPQDAQAQALANQEIQAMDPQPNPDLVAQLEQLDGITIENGEQYTYEHTDFNFNNPALAKREVREAFAKCLPRQQIVETLIRPQNPEAEILQNRWIPSFEAAYEDTSGGLYDEVDIEGARALLQSAGEEGLEVRIGYRSPNQRRTNQVELIKASCDQAGFVISDAGSETFFADELPSGNFDIALFAWAGGPNKTGASSTFITGGGNNQQNYSNPEVDELVTQLNAAVDKDEQLALANQIDTILWEDLATIPIFTFPGILAYSDTVTNIEYNPTQVGLTWNAEKWALA